MAEKEGGQHLSSVNDRRLGLSAQERVWLLSATLFVMWLTCLPYLWAVWKADGRFFGGFIWGVDEGNVYLTWMRQAAEGELFFRNQYSIEPQRPLFFNLYLQLAGRLSGWLHIEPRLIFHLFRFLSGTALLLVFYQLAAAITADRVARWAALGLASLGSGWGWIVVLWAARTGLHPVDVGQDWQTQPEAVTFLSLLLNGLFTASMALMCGVFLYAYRAVQEGSARPLLGAGLCLLVLGNIHTYDVFAVWLALAIWSGVQGGKEGRNGLMQHLKISAAIVLIGLPSVLWAAYATFADPTFLAKGLTPTPAFRLVDYVVAYGFVGLLAAGGAGWTIWRNVVGWRQERKADRGASAERQDREAPGTEAAAWLLPLAWAAAHMFALLLPVSFQRKLIEGLHLPLCLLAGLALAQLARRLTRQLRESGRIRQARERIGLAICAALVWCVPSNVLFVLECMENVRTNNTALLRVLQPPIYLESAELQAMRWLGSHTRREDVVLSSNLMGSYIPTFCRAHVFVGHWAETLHFVQRLREAESLLRGEGGLRALQQAGVAYVFFGRWEQALIGEGAARLERLGLQCVYTAGDVRVYRVPSLKGL